MLPVRSSGKFFSTFVKKPHILCGMALTPKQLIFVNEYLVDKNATRAAKAAGFSAKTAYSQGQRLLKNVEVAAAIEKGLASQVEAATKRAAEAGLTKERWLQELRRIALANMDDYAVIETYKPNKYAKHEVVRVMPKLTKERPRPLGAAIKKISETKNGIGIELHNKLNALELLGKHYGWVKNEFDLQVPGGVQVHLTMPSNGREVSDDKDATTDSKDDNKETAT